MDYLGLRTLTIIDKCLENIRRRGLEPPVMDSSPLDDPGVFELLMAGDTLGVFQLVRGHAQAARAAQARLLRRRDRGPRLCRPGPLESGMVDMFVDRKHGREDITYPTRA